MNNSLDLQAVLVVDRIVVYLDYNVVIRTLSDSAFDENLKNNAG